MATWLTAICWIARPDPFFRFSTSKRSNSGGRRCLGRFVSFAVDALEGLLQLARVHAWNPLAAYIVDPSAAGKRFAGAGWMQSTADAMAVIA
ncbi:MAG: hypothetical protein KGY57_03585 [Gammaproteobacteria bacterium]|nr:hypothetical protein [Gammaproteobacteria bacterium]